MTYKTTIIGISGKMHHGKDALCQYMLNVGSQGTRPYVRRAFADALKEECATFMECLTEGLMKPHSEECGLPTEATTVEGYDRIRNLLGYLLPTDGINVCDTEGSEILLDWYLNDLSMYLRQWGPRPIATSILPEQQAWIHTFNNPQAKPLFRKLLQWYGTEYRRNIFGQDYWLDKMQDFLDAQVPGTVVIAPDMRFPNEANFCTRQNNGYVIRIYRPGMDDTNTHPSETSLDHYTVWNLTVENKGSMEDLEQSSVHVVRLFEQWSDGPKQAIDTGGAWINFPYKWEPYDKGGPLPNPRFA